MPHVMRIWLDELERLPEYSCSKPSGECPGKTWRRNTLAYAGLPGPTRFEHWLIGQYAAVQGAPDEIYTFWFRVDLLQGPRRRNEELRFKVECASGELRALRQQRARSAQEKGK